MNQTDETPEALETKPDTLTVLPIGGCGEVGLNCTLLVDADQGLLIDCGVLFGLPDAPGVDRAIPDLSPILAMEGRIQGLVITHGHEDHIGAIGKLLSAIDIDVYGPPLAIKLIRARLEGQSKKKAKLHEIRFGERKCLGRFDVEWIRVTHSIPDSAAVYVQTPNGNILHTGDFKLDPSPIDGQLTNIERLKSIGDQGLDLLLSDSTNSERDGCTESETNVGLALEKEILDAPHRVLTSCFSSHFHRIQNISNAAAKANRKIIILGRALQRAWALGVQENYLDVPSDIVVPQKYFETLPRNEVLILASGTQGESRAAVARLAQQNDPVVSLESGDYFIRSGMTIPGNVLNYRKVVNAFARQGIKVLHDRGHALHCSGHGHAQEQVEMINFLRPRCFVPIHGERTMLEAHAQTAIRCGVSSEQTMVVENGQSVCLKNGRIEPGPAIKLNPVFLDGVSDRSITWNSVGDRRKVGFGGVVFCTLTFDRQNQLMGTPQFTVSGLPSFEGLESSLSRLLIHKNKKLICKDQEDRKARIKSIIFKYLKKTLGVRPLLQVHTVWED